jgi:shikimate kinase/3-dehydroquinate synthase
LSGIDETGQFGGRGAIALCGFMGAGKSTVGPLVASALGARFVDLDAEIEVRWGPIAQQFASDGEARFRERERDVLREVLDVTPVVVSLGGGAFADVTTRAALRARALTIWLDVPLDVALSRIAGSERPNAPIAAELYPVRQATYVEAEGRVDATASPAEVAASVLALVPTYREVTSSNGPYRVVVSGAGFGDLAAQIARIGVKRVLMVTDDQVAPLWEAEARSALRVATHTIVVPRGEGTKSWDGLGALVDEALAVNVHRDTGVVALGGGMVGDLAGLCAALLLRGLAVIQLPTTLLAMVDSSVGGKTAVNHGRGKNLIGAFHPPALVYAALPTLMSLPAEELRSGLGEVVKTALLDADLFGRLEILAPRLLARDAGALREVVLGCVAVKAAIVEQDERESGIRAWLNLGHTVGHGLESASAGTIPHGIAVAAGLLAELRWSTNAGITEPDVFEQVERLLSSLRLPGRFAAPSAEAVLAAMRVDKKASGAMLRLPVIVRIGAPTLVDLPLSSLPSLLEPG